MTPRGYVAPLNDAERGLATELQHRGVSVEASEVIARDLFARVHRYCNGVVEALDLKSLQRTPGGEV